MLLWMTDVGKDDEQPRRSAVFWMMARCASTTSWMADVGGGGDGAVCGGDGGASGMLKRSLMSMPDALWKLAAQAVSSPLQAGGQMLSGTSSSMSVNPVPSEPAVAFSQLHGHVVARATRPFIWYSAGA